MSVAVNTNMLRVLSIASLLLVANLFVLAQAKKPAVIAYRSVTISTQPSSGVWIDGVKYGTTDKAGKLTIKTVTAGGHTLRVRADGFKEKTQPLAPTQKGEIKIDLVKTTDEAELSFQAAERLLSVDREQAVEAYEKAIKLRPNYPDAYVALARVLTELGDLDLAGAAIASARKFRPGFAEASAVMGRIYKESGEEEKAITSFKRAITEGKGFQPEAYSGLGLLYKEKAEGFGGSGDFENEGGNYVESAKYLKSAVKQLAGAPDTMVIMQLLGLVYEREKKYADAIAVYEEFLTIFPNAVEATAVRSFIVQLKKDLANQ
ncbi:MAG: tetratricopeptide repeat protein [Chloracidobacterium sp.]|nr:tetratricopeptide repeat protein [Chloracidobacterium sp.]